MESLKHKSPYILLPNCNKMLIFGKWAFFIMLFPNILINPIISKIQIFLMSHCATCIFSEIHLAYCVVCIFSAQYSILLYIVLNPYFFNFYSINLFLSSMLYLCTVHFYVIHLNFQQDLMQKKYQADSCIRDLRSKLTAVDEVNK